MANDRRVVVSGLGVVSSIGIGWPEFWKNLLAGKSGVSDISFFDTTELSTHVAGLVRDFKPEEFLSIKKCAELGRSSQFAVAATKLAFSDAKLKIRGSRLSKIGTFIGTTMGEPQILEVMNKAYFLGGSSAIDPHLVNRYSAQNISFNVAHELKLNGLNLLIANACSAGNFSIGYAYDCIRSGKLDIAVVGGVDCITRLNLTGFNRLLSLAPEQCQPFDKNRKGIVVGEGAGFLILETPKSALKRKANIYAEILGYGLSCDAHSMTEPTLEGVSKAMQKVLLNTGVLHDEVDYISAHGTGTPKNDLIESQAINTIFHNRKVLVSSIKSMLGHTMGAASAIEAIACCLAIKTQMVPPTINYQVPDPECDIDCVPNKARECVLNMVLNNSFAFGGSNASLALKRFINT